MLFKHAATTLEFSRGTERQRGDKKIREKGGKKEVCVCGERINKRTQRGVDENQTKQVTCAPRPHMLRQHSNTHTGGNNAS